MKTLNQRGSSHLVLILAVVVVVVAGVVGYRVMNTSETNTDVVSSKASEPDSIKSTADVKRASAALDDTAIDGPVNPDQLDSDLNALL